MTKTSSQPLLDKYSQHAEKAALWLQRSLQKTISFQITENISESEFDVLENLTSRFARLSDILFQKVFRAIDTAELETPGSIIDVLNRAAKRGIVANDKMARELRELRNTIAHEYTEEQLIELFKKIRKVSPELLVIHENAKKYIAGRFP